LTSSSSVPVVSVAATAAAAAPSSTVVPPLAATPNKSRPAGRYKLNFSQQTEDPRRRQWEVLH
jgi:hypothetical protein